MVINIQIGPNVDVSQELGIQSEPTIAINPKNTQQLFVASKDDEDEPKLSTRYSTDGGITWIPSPYIFDGIGVSAGLPIACCDPIARADTNGNLFLAYLSDDRKQIVLVVSSDFGQSFTLVGTSAFSPLISNDVDQPHLATATLSSGDLLVYMCWVDFGVGGTSGRPAGIYIAGARYTTLPVSLVQITAEAPNSSIGNFGDISISRTGKVMITYQDSSTGNTGPSDIFINTCDGSIPLTTITWSARSLVATSNIGAFWIIPSQASRTIDVEAKLSWDRSNKSFNNRVYLSYTDATTTVGVTTGPTSMSIKVIHSDDDGVNWSSPKNIRDTTINSSYFPRSAIDQTTGIIGISWYDCRNATDIVFENQLYQVFCSFSEDGGNTWLKNIQVGKSLTDANNGSIDAGDYSDCTFHQGLFYPAWTDSNTLNGANPGPLEDGYEVPEGTLQLDIATARIRVTKRKIIPLPVIIPLPPIITNACGY